VISGGASITISDTAGPAVQRLASALRRQSYRPAVGRAGIRALIDHFAAKNLSFDSHRTANELGARPTQLYADFAKATSYSHTSTGVTISINHVAARQRYHGGDIRPVNVKALAIPAAERAYGRSPREFDNLFVMVFKRGGAALAERESTDISIISDRRKGREGQKRVKKGRERGGGILFWLVKHVTQQGDETVLPKEEELIQAVTDALSGWLKTVTKGGSSDG
jgi:hypothetical protein